MDSNNIFSMKSSEFLTSLIDAGADAMTNLYYMEIVQGEGGDLDKDSLFQGTVRAEQITLPSFKQDSHESHFATISGSFPSPSFSGAKQLSVTFRLDSDYRLYEVLQKLQKPTSVPDFGYAATVIPDESGVYPYFTINLYTMKGPVTNPAQEYRSGYSIDPENNYKILYKFEYCWVPVIQPITFNSDSSSVITVRADIKFYKFQDPQNLISW